MKPIIVIPARMSSTRLPGKPLKDIGGVPMIVHVLRRGVEANLGPVIVASGDWQISNVVTAHAGTVVDTDPSLPSGTDRIAAALSAYDPQRLFDIVVNLQGDMPTIDPRLLRTAVDCLVASHADMATLACPMNSCQELNRDSVVKVAMEPDLQQPNLARAIYFSRAAIPHGADTYFHHIGLYVYRRAALERFVTSPQSRLESLERLEQLRALSLGMKVAVAVVNTRPLGVDLLADLEEARRQLTGTPGIRG